MELAQSARGLATMTQGAEGPYRNYQDALRAYHVVAGVTRAALSAEVDMAIACGEFAQDFASKLPPLELVCFDVVATSGNPLKPDITAGLISDGVRFRTDDSVHAESVAASVVWDNYMPHYVIGGAKSGYLIATPAVTLAPKEYLKIWQDSQDSKPGYVASRLERKMDTFIYKGYLSGKAKLVYKSNRHADRVLQSGLPVFVDNYEVNNGKKSHFATDLLTLAPIDISPEGVEQHQQKMRKLFDTQTRQFIIARRNLGSEVVELCRNRYAPPEDESPQKIPGDKMVEFRVAERLAVLALRFSLLDSYQESLDGLCSAMKDISKNAKTPYDLGHSLSGQSVAEQMLEVIRAEQRAKESQRTEESTHRTAAKQPWYKRIVN